MLQVHRMPTLLFPPGHLVLVPLRHHVYHHPACTWYAFELRAQGKHHTNSGGVSNTNKRHVAFFFSCGRHSCVNMSCRLSIPMQIFHGNIFQMNAALLMHLPCPLPCLNRFKPNSSARQTVAM